MTNVFPGLLPIQSPLFPMLKASQGLTQEEEEIANRLYEEGYPQSNKALDERRVQDAWSFDENVRAIASNEAALDLLSKLYGRCAFPFQTLNFPVGTQQDAHSDSVHFSSLPERFMCGVWLAMEDVDVDADSGPLFYHPGSHRWPVMSNARIGRRGYGGDLSSAEDNYGPAWCALREAHGTQEETFLARKWQALIWCANLLHGGSHQADPRLTRWSQVTHYCFDDCIYYTSAFSDEVLGRLQLRDLAAISNGMSRPNKYLGEIVENSTLKIEPPTGPSLRRRLVKRLRG